MDRNTVLWTLVLFFGASIMFAAIRDATRDESSAISLGAQAGAGLLLVAALIVYVRRRK